MNDNYDPIISLYIFAPLTGDEAFFVLYQSGFLLYRHERHQFFSLQLNPEELAAFLADLPIDEFFTLENGYTASRGTDQGICSLKVWKDGALKHIYIHGNPEIKADHFARNPDFVCPPAYLKIFQTLIYFQDERAKPWLPEKIEVSFYETTVVTPKTHVWDKTWPDLTHPETRPYGAAAYGISYVIFLPSEHLEALKRILQPRYAIHMNGKIGYISYRLPIPNEEKAWWLPQRW